jgi:CRP/FNR family transcriptional regulator, cyclic AMP receptor protein
MPTSDQFKQVPLLKALPESERRLIADKLVEARYGKGEVIFREGDPADYFHILTEGAVKCVKSSAHGKDITLKVLLPGDLFCCEAAVMEGAAHPGCALPMGDVKVLRLHRKVYFDILRRNPEAALDIIKYLGRRLNEAQENVKGLALEKAEQRVASLLLNLANRAAIRESNGIRLTIRLTRQDLADIAGITVETAIRIMSHFRRRQIVSGTGSSLIIHDLARLKRLTTPSRLSSRRPHTNR